MIEISSQLLPIDGLGYQTRFGYFTASVVKPPQESRNLADLQRVEIEFSPETRDSCPVRRLALHVSTVDLIEDLPGVMRFITDWVLSDPGDGKFFEFEYHYRRPAARAMTAGRPNSS